VGGGQFAGIIAITAFSADLKGSKGRSTALFD
jgi:hypothetical protein